VRDVVPLKLFQVSGVRLPCHDAQANRLPNLAKDSFLNTLLGRQATDYQKCHGARVNKRMTSGASEFGGKAGEEGLFRRSYTGLQNRQIIQRRSVGDRGRCDQGSLPESRWARRCGGPEPAAGAGQEVMCQETFVIYPCCEELV
jgi:hypothetical protein